MVKIFAKKGTDEKAVVVCTREHVPHVIMALENQFGGNWLLVDKIDYTDKNEIIKFNDGLIYKGFEPNKDDRYCKSIIELGQPKYNPPANLRFG